MFDLLILKNKKLIIILGKKKLSCYTLFRSPCSSMYIFFFFKNKNKNSHLSLATFSACYRIEFLDGFWSNLGPSHGNKKKRVGIKVWYVRDLINFITMFLCFNYE